MNSMVYITNASLKLIVKSLRDVSTTLSRDKFLSIISEDFSSSDFSRNDFDMMFNNEELKDTYYLKVVLQNFKTILHDIGDNKQLVTDYIAKENKKYVKNVKVPSYHIDSECKWMRKDFDNIEIPSEFNVNKMIEIKQRIALNKNDTFDELNEKFKLRYKTELSLKKILLKNSGVTDFNNYDISSKLKETTIRKQLTMLFDGEFAKKLQNFRYTPKYKMHRIIKQEEKRNSRVAHAFLDFQSAKQEFELIIFNFYVNKYNMKLSFQESILKSIGFRTCKGCSIDNHTYISTSRVA